MTVFTEPKLNPRFRVDPYMGKAFCARTYNCWHFVREAWKDLTGLDLGEQTPDVRSAQVYTERALQVANTLKQLEKPSNPCIVLFQRKRIEPHVGIYYNGKVLHLDTNGVQYLPLIQVSAKFTSVSFYVDSRFS